MPGWCGVLMGVTPLWAEGTLLGKGVPEGPTTGLGAPMGFPIAVGLRGGTERPPAAPRWRQPSRLGGHGGMKQASWALLLHRAPGEGVSPQTAPLPATCCSARCPPPCPVLPVPGPDRTHQGLLVLQRPLLRALGGGHGAPGAPGAPGRAGAGARGSSNSSRGRAGRTRGIARGRARPRSASAARTAAPGTGTGQPGTDRGDAGRGSLRAL